MKNKGSVKEQMIFAKKTLTDGTIVDLGLIQFSSNNKFKEVYVKLKYNYYFNSLKRKIQNLRG